MEKKKIEEANEHVRLAEKHLKTSPLKLKFTPDWDPAGDEFSRAATCYKVRYINGKKNLVFHKFLSCFLNEFYPWIFQVLTTCRERKQEKQISKFVCNLSH